MSLVQDTGIQTNQQLAVVEYSVVVAAERRCRAVKKMAQSACYDRDAETASFHDPAFVVEEEEGIRFCNVPSGQ